ncbi:MAG: histidine phosphatase family protein [Ilumatobacteraceae bacterium]
MELLLVRHGLPVRRELLEGAADPELSDAGVAQAECLAEYLSIEDVHAIYASPLRRAVQTATPLAKRFDLPVMLVEGIAEFDRHASSYVPIEELKAAADPRWQQLIDDDWTGRTETKREFVARTSAAIEEIIAANRSRNVVVVCHGGVINAFLARVLGTGDNAGFFYPNYTSIHRVIASSEGLRQILTLNETAHLRGTGLPIGLYGR